MHSRTSVKRLKQTIEKSSKCFRIMIEIKLHCFPFYHMFIQFWIIFAWKQFQLVRKTKRNAWLTSSIRWGQRTQTNKSDESTFVLMSIFREGIIFGMQRTLRVINIKKACQRCGVISDTESWFWAVALFFINLHGMRFSGEAKTKIKFYLQKIKRWMFEECIGWS